LSNLNTPTAEQLAAVRLAHWHQNAEPILTINMLRDWLNTAGLVFFTPRAAQLPAPAPSFVEAILGVTNGAPTLADTEQTRSLFARLVLDGGAIPLNLLGNPTGTGSEAPDFLVSPLAFPYLFTLRGDKAWKLPPATSGATKVSPLALNTYSLLTERSKDEPSGMSSYDLTTHLGKEVTETAVLRALTELWQHLRVFPVPQLDGAATLWELTSTRFTKQIKAGANAGQPTALSALISMYLGQAIVASEEDIETFLSPVAPRSRIRDVIHALLSARQLETIAVEGRTVLHIAGELPAFLAAAAPAAEETNSIPGVDTDEVENAGEAPRITKFIPKPRKTGTGFVTKPGRTSSDSPPPRERRPFTRESNRPDRPSFTKPWAEEKADRLAASQSSSGTQEAGASESPARAYNRGDRKPGFDREGKRPFSSKPSFGSRPGFGSKPRFGSDRPASGGNRPSFRRNEDSADSRPPRREFAPRPNDAGTGESGGDRPRKTFSKPGTFGRKREGFAGKPGFRRDNESADSRPPRREFSARPSGDQGPRRPGSYAARPASGGRGPDGARGTGSARSGEDSRPSGLASRKPWTPREGAPGPSRSGGGKPSFSRDRDNRAPRSGGFAANRGEDRNEGRAGRPSGPPYRKFDAPRTPRPFSSDRSSGGGRPDQGGRSSRPEGGYAAKPGGGSGEKKPYGKKSEGGTGRPGFTGRSSSSFGGKKPYGKVSAGGAGKPASTFDKFKDNKKPFGKRPPSRKFKREESE